LNFLKLNKYKKNITSQYGEDGILLYLIKNSKFDIVKTSIEFGADDGIKFSNTYNLWKNLGFNSLLIEENKDKYNKLNSNYGNSISSLNCKVNSVGKDSIDEIVNRDAFKDFKNLGVLSIDIDSYDYYILYYLQIKPQIIVIEFNNSIPGHIDYKDPEGEVFLRCSAKAIQNLGFIKGYKSVACTVTNVILLREDCFDDDKHPDLPVEYLLDYEGMSETNNRIYSIIHSQIFTSKLFFTKKPNILDRFYFNLSRRLFSMLNIKREKYKKPSQRIVDAMKNSGLYF